jgi:hypothetical protein
MANHQARVPHACAPARGSLGGRAELLVMSLARSLKVHLRVLDVLGTTLRVVTLRPQTEVRFSTNYFHDTWHILADRDGASLLGRLLWGLAFQRLPGTLLLIDRPHLVPTPFDGDPPDRIIVIPEGLTRFDPELLRALAVRLRRDPGPPTTIRWHTFGMPAAAIERDRAWARRDWGVRYRVGRRPLAAREQMSRTAGFVCYTAPPEILREHGLGIHDLQDCTNGSYYPLADLRHHNTWGYDGEFQLIPGFADRVSAAITARREILGAAAGGLADRPIVDEEARFEIYDRQEVALARLHEARGGRRRGDRP